MNIYVYDSSTINHYLTEDRGLLSSVEEVFDCGCITSVAEETEDFYVISCSETLTPFGTISTNKNTTAKTYKVSSAFIRLEKLNKKSIILTGIIITWYGYGTVFELSNGLERQVIPDVSGGGMLV
jgi:hypothetical protein